MVAPVERSYEIKNKDAGGTSAYSGKGELTAAAGVCPAGVIVRAERSPLLTVVDESLSHYNAALSANNISCSSVFRHNGGSVRIKERSGGFKNLREQANTESE